jgi:uncharacterized protein (DUF1330 family)
MPAYMVADVDVSDPERYREYSAQVAATVEAHGGGFLVRGGAAEAIEGDWLPTRFVIIEFPSKDAARAWYDSAEYQSIVGIRHEASTTRLILVDGAAS